jgi:acyl-CoA thioester hydrolase
MAERASIVTRRRLEWSETDPMDRWHYSVVLRFVESAETLLHHRLGIQHDEFRRMPRLNVTVDFLGALHYDETAETALAVEHVGRSSMRYAFTVSRDGRPLARGTMTVAWFDPETGRSAPWPDRLRKLFGGSGPVPASEEG